jgi:hypothetical protein
MKRSTKTQDIEETLNRMLDLLEVAESGLNSSLIDSLALRHVTEYVDLESREQSVAFARLDRYLGQVPHPHLPIYHHLGALNQIGTAKVLLDEVSRSGSPAIDAHFLEHSETLRLVRNILDYEQPRSFSDILHLRDLVYRKEIQGIFLWDGRDLGEVVFALEFAGYATNSDCSDIDYHLFEEKLFRGNTAHEIGLLDKISWQETVERSILSSSPPQGNPFSLITTLKAFEDSHVFSSRSQLRGYMLEEIFRGIEATSSLETRTELVVKLLEEPRLREVSARNRAITLLVNAQKELLGSDDLSERYLQNIEALVQELEASNLLPIDRLNIRLQLGVSLRTQEKATEILDPGLTISREDLESTQIYGVAIQAILQHVTSEPHLSESILTFLCSEQSRQSLATVEVSWKKSIEDLQRNWGLRLDDLVPVNQAFFSSFHDNFWDLSAEQRAVISARLLTTIEESRKGDPYQLVGKFLFKDINEANSIHYRIFRCYLDSIKDHERLLILGGMMAASQRTENSETLRLGQALTSLADTLNDPAITKVLQGLHSNPATPLELREDLKDVKSRGSIPTRRELLDLVNSNVPPELRSQISYIGDILGAGSYWVVVKVKMDDDSTCALRLLRTFSDKRAATGFDKLETTIDRFASQIDTSLSLEQQEDSRLLVLLVRQAIKQGKAAIPIETSGVIGAKQYKIAQELYGDSTVTVGNKVFSPHLVPWRAYGEEFVLMELAPGIEFNELAKEVASSDIPSESSIAYYTVELLNMLRGGVFDHDRHGAQLFQEKEDTMLWLIDTGAMALSEPSPSDRRMAGRFFAKIQNSLIHGMKIESAVMLSLQKMYKQAGELPQYVIEVQRGLLALADFSRHIPQDRMFDIVSAVMNTGLVHKDFQIGYSLERLGQNPFVFAAEQFFRGNRQSRYLSSEPPVSVEVRPATSQVSPKLYSSERREHKLRLAKDGQYVVNRKNTQNM